MKVKHRIIPSTDPNLYSMSFLFFLHGMLLIGGTISLTGINYGAILRFYYISPLNFMPNLLSYNRDNLNLTIINWLIGF